MDLSSDEDLEASLSDEEMYFEEEEVEDVPLDVGQTWPTSLSALETHVANPTNFLAVLLDGVMQRMAEAPTAGQVQRLVRLLIERSFAPMPRKTRRAALAALAALAATNVAAVAGALAKHSVNVRGIRQHAFIVACGCAIGPAVAASVVEAKAWLPTFAAAHLNSLGALGLRSGSTHRSASAGRVRRAAVRSVRRALCASDGALFAAYFAAAQKLYAKRAKTFERRGAEAVRAEPGFGVGLALHTVLAIAAERADFAAVNRAAAIALLLGTGINARHAAAALPPLLPPRSGVAAASEWEKEPAARQRSIAAEEASAVAAAASAEPFEPLLRQLTHADLASIVPALCAAMKARPAALLPLAIRAARLVPTDLSRYVATDGAIAELGACVAELVTHPEAQVQALNAVLIESIVTQCSDARATVALIGAIAAQTKGDGEAKDLQLGQLRAVGAVHPALASLSSAAALKVAEACIAFAATIFSGRATVTVRIEAITVMGRFAGVASDIVERAAEGECDVPVGITTALSAIASGITASGADPKLVYTFSRAAELATHSIGPRVSSLFVAHLVEPLRAIVKQSTQLSSGGSAKTAAVAAAAAPSVAAFGAVAKKKKKGKKAAKKKAAPAPASTASAVVTLTVSSTASEARWRGYLAGLEAVLSLLRLCSSSEEGEAAVSAAGGKVGLWAVLGDGESFVYANAPVAGPGNAGSAPLASLVANPDVLARILAALVSVVTLSLSKFSSSIGASGAIVPLLRLAVSLAADVRVSGAAATMSALFEGIANAQAALYADLLPDLIQSARDVIATLSDGYFATNASRTSQAVRMIVPPGAEVSSSVSSTAFAQLLLLAHHPVLHVECDSARSIDAHRGASRHPFRTNPAVWRAVCWRLRGVDPRSLPKRRGTPYQRRDPDPLPATPEIAAFASWGDDYVAAIASVILGEDGLGSESECWRDAARASVAGLVLVARGEQIMRVVYESLLPQFESGAAHLAALDEADVEVSRKPAGSLVREYDAEVANKQRQKQGSRGGKAKKLTDDEKEWARIERKRRIAKGLPEEDVDEKREALVVRDREVRKVVAEAFRSSLHAARTLRALAQIAPRLIRAEMANLVNAYAPAGSIAAHINAILLESKEIVGELPVELLSTIVAATAFSLPRELATLWIYSLRTARSGAPSDTSAASLFAAVFKALPSPCGTAPGSLVRAMSTCPGTRQVWLPIVANPISSSSEQTTSPFLREALAVLQVMATPPPRDASAATVTCWRSIRTHLAGNALQALLYAPAYKPSPEDVLVLMYDGIVEHATADADALVPLLTQTGILCHSKQVRAACLSALEGVALEEIEGDAHQLYVSLRVASCDHDAANASSGKLLLQRVMWKAEGLIVSRQLMHMAKAAHSRDDTIRRMVGKALSELIAETAPLAPPGVVEDEALELVLGQYHDSIGKRRAFELLLATETSNERWIRTGDQDPDKVVEYETDDAWAVRCGVACILNECGLGHAFGASGVQSIMAFIVDDGTVDPQPEVRLAMLDAGTALIDTYGESMVDAMLPPIEAVLERTRIGGGDDQELDWQREGATVLCGRLARHLAKDDARIVDIMRMLVESLKTPSQSVQESAAACLPALMRKPLVQEQAHDLLSNMLRDLTSKKSTYALQRGSAYGLAGMVKGLGTGGLSRYGVNVVEHLLTSAEDTKDKAARQGALFGIELLTAKIGLLFEAYVIKLLPVMLKCCGDSNKEVRAAAKEAARVVMATLSGPGVKLVMPKLLVGLQADQWRTKQAAIRMLGSMAFCAPRQLSACLPQIVPALVDYALCSTQPKVRAAGKTALKEIGSVVRNPEILRLVPSLTKALLKPSEFTSAALKKLTRTSFIHAIDAPSLALIIPTITRGMKSRKSATKKMAASIAGSICSLVVSPNDVIPYIPDLWPGLQMVVVDPIPDVRAVAAHAVGTLMKTMGEGTSEVSMKYFEEVDVRQMSGPLGGVVPWLIHTLMLDSSSSERSGAAQTLCRVLSAVPNDRFDEVMHVAILPKASRAAEDRWYVREGVMWVLTYLSTFLKVEQITALLDEIFPIVVQALDDTEEVVRDVSMRAGEEVINRHIETLGDRIMPFLRTGLIDGSWRTRQGSVRLFGTALQKYLEKTGGIENFVGGDMYKTRRERRAAERAAARAARDSDDSDDSDDEEIVVAEKKKAALELSDAGSTGVTHQKVLEDSLASLFIACADIHGPVKFEAQETWKSIVPNAAALLKRIMPTIIPMIVGQLSSENEDHREVASAALGELVSRVGDNVMREVLPVLISSLTNPDSDVAARQGVCLGLAEVISCGSQRQLEAHLEVVRFAVRQAMCDENEEVRAAASGAFSALVKSFGQHAVKEMVPSLLDALEASSDEDATLTPEHATHGLRAVIELRGRVVMPMIVARLVEPPITAARASAMKTVAKAASTIIHLYLPKLLPPLLQTIADGVADPAVIDASRDAATAIVMSIRGDAGLRALVSRLGELVDNSEGANLRAEGAWLMGKLCEGAAADLEEFVPTILSHLVMLYSSQDEAILAAALSALTALTAARSDEELSEHIPAIRSVVAGMRSDMKHKMHLGDEELLLPGLCQKNGLKPMLPMFQHALLKGTPVMREHAAAGIGELIGLTSPAALKPFIIKLTGPLIRIMHDRFPRGVKIAILDTLITLIHMGGARLRPFLPQLQTTFVKALGDPESAVRSQSIKALTALLDLKPRVGPLIGELRAGAVSAPTENIQAAMLEALSRVLRSPMKMTASTLTLITGCFDAVMDASMLGNESDAVRRAAADVIAAAIALMPGDQASDLLRSTIFPIAKDGFASPWPLRHGMAVTLGAVLASSNDSAELEGVVSVCADEVMAILVDSTADDRAQVQRAAHRSISQFVARAVKIDEALDHRVLDAIAQAIEDPHDVMTNDSLIGLKSGVKMLDSMERAGTLGVNAQQTRAHLVTLLLRCAATASDAGTRSRANRMLVYALSMRQSPSTLQTFISEANSVTSALLKAHLTRALQKAADTFEASDGEEEVEEEEVLFS